jgi:DNA-binding response OmpR family regulator
MAIFGLFKKSEAQASVPVTTGPDEAAEESAPRIRALLIDDDEQLLKLLTTAMERYLGPEIVTADDGAKAVQLLSEQSFDLIISDFALPSVSGWQLFFWIAKNRPELVHRFLLISGALGDNAEAQAIENMGIRVLRKPFSIHEYIEACREVLQNQLGTK